MDASFINGLTALAGGAQIGATLISRTFSRFTTVASVADSAILPLAAGGLTYTVANATANAMNVFPAVGDAINTGSANAALSIPAGKTAQFSSMVPGFWNAILSA